MRLNLPIFDQDRTLSVSSTQGSLHYKKLQEGTLKKIQNGVIKFELHPFMPRDSTAVHWITKICGNRLKAFNQSRFVQVKADIQKTSSNFSKMSNEIFFYKKKNASGVGSGGAGSSSGSIIWRSRSESEQLVVFPVSCYSDTFCLNISMCQVPETDSQFFSEANILLKQHENIL